MSEKLKLSPPWVTYVRKIEALFGEDPDIKIEYDEANLILKLFIENPTKADAIQQLLPTEKVFGNITLAVQVIPANKPQRKIDIFQKAFEGNPVFSYAVSVDGISSNDYNFVVFRHKICQFWNDQMNDINGNVSTLYEDVARDIFENADGVFFNTETPDNLGKPTVDWGN